MTLCTSHLYHPPLPRPTGIAGEEPAKVQGNYFSIVPAEPGYYGGFNIRTLIPMRFSVVYGGAKSRVVTISLSPQGRAYTRALKSEKSLSLPIPIGGGAVDTNDWCIKLTNLSSKNKADPLTI